MELVPLLVIVFMMAPLKRPYSASKPLVIKRNSCTASRLGWTPASSDSHNVLHDIMGCRDDAKDATRGEANLGGYCNKQVDALTDKILLETDDAKRDQLIKQAFEIGIKEYGYIPLHQQALAWGVSKKVKLTQRADNQVLLYWATKQE